MAKVALLIGVSEYEPGLNTLPAAVKDIEALQRVLKDSEMGGFDEVKALPNPDRQTMESEIETLFSGRAKDDLVLLFFSGHGIKDDGGKLYFATRITRKNPKGELIRSTAVPANFVQEIMNNSRAKRQAIILDCCFSGAFDPALHAKDDGSVDLQSLGAEGRVVLTSSSSTQYSFEQQGSDLSIYTRYLVEGIETGAGDRNEDGFVSVMELHEYAVSKVQETAPKMTPKIIVLKDKGFEIVLSKARVTDPKLKYRKAASRYANAGTIRPSARAILNILKQQLGLTSEEAAEIEAEVLRPYQERLVNLQSYRETLIAEAEHEYPLSEETHEEMNMLQELLGLRDTDILPIKQEVEAQFAQKNKTYDVILQGFQMDKKIAVLRAIRELTGLPLNEAKDLVESTPKPVKEGIDLKAAKEVQKLIEVAGGKVVVRYESSSIIWEEDETKDKIYDVILQGFQADKKIAVLKTIRELTGLPLKEAKDLVESTPKPVKEGIDLKAAEEAKKLIEVKGGKVIVIINAN
ncbi:MAG: ribosomal protein L7/L12 [Nostoc sp.]